MNRSMNGPSTRSWNPGSISSFSACGAAENASTTASDLETPRASLVNTPTAVRDRKMPAKIPRMPVISRTVVTVIRPPA